MFFFRMHGIILLVFRVTDAIVTYLMASLLCHGVEGIESILNVNGLPVGTDQICACRYQSNMYYPYTTDTASIWSSRLCSGKSVWISDIGVQPHIFQPFRQLL